MKHSAAKTLGVAALGAAFAATAAGSASAVVSPATAGLEATNRVLPVAMPLAGAAIEQLPGQTTEALGTAQGLTHAVQGLPVDPAVVTSLLHSLPVGGSLPAAGL
ncbi:hypothetical protein ACIRNI_09510 [Streptomyces sp. NPDC093546]|uniref:hypothetical protein n=1 Tax=Streptomyces sp. NPDC093546 TaxID=3366040 RepID=UPI00381B7826